MFLTESKQIFIKNDFLLPVMFLVIMSDLFVVGALFAAPPPPPKDSSSQHTAPDRNGKQSDHASHDHASHTSDDKLKHHNDKPKPKHLYPLRPRLPETPFDYANVMLPAHFINNDFPDSVRFVNAVIDNDNTPLDNPITNEGATLGRVLFYDKKLSQNGEIACASCHLQELAFADGQQFSTGFDGVSVTRRNSMGLSNARFYQSGKAFWDERAATLEMQVLMPFQDPVEMGLTLSELVSKVDKIKYYDALFVNAFGNSEVNDTKIANALAQFVRSMVSFDSKYDEGRAQVEDPLQPFPNFTEQENLGKSIFMGVSGDRSVTCIGCHTSEAFVSAPTEFQQDPAATTSTVNIGIDDSDDPTIISDLGVFESTNNPVDTGKFKAPSLRNIALTAPYMHDGRLDTLEEVVEHYSTGIKNHPNLPPFLKDENGEAIDLNFSPEEKAALVEFLNTLTDWKMVNDEKFSNPF